MAYLKAGLQLSDELFAAVHLTAGLPARGSEITTLKVRNTDQVLRNIFILHGRIIIVYEYNKTRSSNNHSFFVVQYLPQALSCLFYQYLVYIRPFLDFLYSQLGLAALRSTEFLSRPEKEALVKYSIYSNSSASYFTLPYTNDALALPLSGTSYSKTLYSRASTGD
jgi:hypothetical protein